MGIRITTWNVNGIRNPFGYEPWREKRTFEAMFETLETDIVVMQETKIQRKDLSDDMVLVPGWDVYFSLPKYKKGYSGVAIYTRNSKCCPIRAEEGITGILCPPNSSTSFRDLPPEQQIGGYPKLGQLSSTIDEPTLDSEGRCVILEFPAFVLIGVYSPATRDDTRTDFRLGFLEALDARVRNLVDMGKQVVLTGDLNIIRSEIDTAGVKEMLRKEDMTLDEFMSTPSRRFLNQLVFGGRVVGERDEGREQPVLWDLCRIFHRDRLGMYTCWETKKNARPGNYGSRIDYVLCSNGLREWFEDSNIQEGLLGSDHCPVYATLKDTIEVNGQTLHVIDKMNPEGMFVSGKRLQEWSTKRLLPTSAKLIPEFDRRRSIRDMFFKPALPSKNKASNKEASLPDIPETSSEMPPAPTLGGALSKNKETEIDFPTEPNLQTVSLVSSRASLPAETSVEAQTFLPPTPPITASASEPPSSYASNDSPAKRQAPSPVSKRPQKKNKGALKKESSKSGPSKNQSSLMGFFKPKTPTPTSTSTFDLEKETDGANDTPPPIPTEPPSPLKQAVPVSPRFISKNKPVDDDIEEWDADPPADQASRQDKVHDPIVAKESWSKLLGKRVPPMCEHNEPCISLLTKKPGVNCGEFSFSLVPSIPRSAHSPNCFPCLHASLQLPSSITIVSFSLASQLVLVFFPLQHFLLLLLDASFCYHQHPSHHLMYPSVAYYPSTSCSPSSCPPSSCPLLPVPLFLSLCFLSPFFLSSCFLLPCFLSLC
ncbi:DNase I-like protein [Coniochaeta ligniaria NRRL 30616]|uniref:DNase I-like protein n=1 Tax=Coniochaeta ligniaria NRRL 30616 TaxID=1408157 RepID=A0A1J7JS44_9PEZI|nr:DNase I-like protein [Coniochaeta ligniaria NRRL 30616]